MSTWISCKQTFGREPVVFMNSSLWAEPEERYSVHRLIYSEQLKCWWSFLIVHQCAVTQWLKKTHFPSTVNGGFCTKRQKVKILHTWCQVMFFFLSIVNFRFLWLLILFKCGWSDDLTNLNRILSWAVKGQTRDFFFFFLPTAFEIFEMSADVLIKFEPFSQFCHPLYQRSQIWNKTVRQWMVFIT